jgi:hypothetical protein
MGLEGDLARVCEANAINDRTGLKRWGHFNHALTLLIASAYDEEALAGQRSPSFLPMKKRLAFATVLSLVCAPVAGIAGNSADINASGSTPSFCDISNTGGPIAMSISAEKDKLSGTGTYQFVANGDTTVTLSLLSPTAPQGAAAYTPSVSLANLVSSTSTTAAVTGDPKLGINKLTGNITTEILQNNADALLSAGAYSVAATATCTAL